MNIDVLVLDNRLHSWGFPRYGSEHAAGLDLYACLDAPICLEPQGEPKLISSGAAFRIPDPSWCALLLPRSGAAHSRGLVLSNAVGLIDADYMGPCLISAWNRQLPGPNAQIVVSPGERIAQLVFVRTGRPSYRIVESFEASSERGSSGFGSTGR
jgi:dUTP pyrophosphatase